MNDGVWKWEAAEISNRERIAELLEANWKQNEIARVGDLSLCRLSKSEKIRKRRMTGQRIKQD